MCALLWAMGSALDPGVRILPAAPIIAVILQGL
jgi:hypothetical protein